MFQLLIAKYFHESLFSCLGSIVMNKPNINEEEDYEEERIQQFINNEEPNTNEEDYTEIEDS